MKPARPNNQEQPQRIELPEGSHRGGLLGMAAMLAVSSHPHRTSPVLRGKWLLDAILGTPPPPPPPDVPALEESKRSGAYHTLRERLAQHRANPACASCHSRIDPLGFALENYDVIGRWRTEEAGKPIDAQRRVAGRHDVRRPGSIEGRAAREEGLVHPQPDEQDARICSWARPDAAGFLHGGWHCRRSGAKRLQRADTDQCRRLERAVSIPGQAPHRSPLSNRVSIRSQPAKGTEEAMMIPRDQTISRRTVLRGAGVALGLPWLEAMMPVRRLHRACNSQSPGAHGGALHGERREHPHVDAGGTGPRFQAFADARAAAGSEGPDLVVSNSGTRRANTGDGHYVKEVEHPDLHHHQQDARRRYQHARRVDGPGGCAAHRRPDAAAFARTGDRAGGTGVDANVGYTRVYGSPHRLERPDHAAGARDQSAVGLRAAVPGGESGRRSRRSRTRCCWIACSGDAKKTARRSRRRRSGADGRVSVGRAVARRRGWSGRRSEAQRLEAACPLDRRAQPADASERVTRSMSG